MVGTRVKTNAMLLFVIIVTLNGYAEGQIGCESLPVVPGGVTAPAPVLRMCTTDSARATRVLLDTTLYPGETLNCSCRIQATGNTVSVSMVRAPNDISCQSELRVDAYNPYTFRCLAVGRDFDASLKTEFNIHYRQLSNFAINNYCAEIYALPSIGGSLQVVNVECQGAQRPSTTSSAPTPSSSSTDVMWKSTWPGEITSDDMTYSTTKTTGTTSYVGYTGFPSSVSQTAIIIICVVAGAGLLVAIIIAVAAIVGHRSECQGNEDKTQSSVSRTDGSKDKGIEDKKEVKLHRTKKIHSPVSHKAYDNKAYDRSFRDSLVVSENL